MGGGGGRGREWQRHQPLPPPPPQVQAGTGPTHWNCDVCTLENTRERRNCEACGSRRPRQGSEVEDEGFVLLDRELDFRGEEMFENLMGGALMGTMLGGGAAMYVYELASHALVVGRWGIWR